MTRATCRGTCTTGRGGRRMKLLVWPCEGLVSRWIPASSSRRTTSTLARRGCGGAANSGRHGAGSSDEGGLERSARRAARPATQGGAVEEGDSGTPSPGAGRIEKDDKDLAAAQAPYERSFRFSRCGRCGGDRDAHGRQRPWRRGGRGKAL